MSSIGSQVETLLAFVCAIAIVMLTALVVVWFTGLWARVLYEAFMAGWRGA